MENLTSKSQLMASKKYDMKYDKICVRLPRGTTDAIKALGHTSLNKFAISAIENEIKKQKKQLELFPELNYKEYLAAMEAYSEVFLHYPDADTLRRLLDNDTITINVVTGGKIAAWYYDEAGHEAAVDVETLKIIDPEKLY